MQIWIYRVERAIDQLVWYGFAYFIFCVRA